MSMPDGAIVTKFWRVKPKSLGTVKNVRSGGMKFGSVNALSFWCGTLAGATRSVHRKLLARRVPGHLKRGQRAIVRGGRNGMTLPSKTKRLIAHTHPYGHAPKGPSNRDRITLRALELDHLAECVALVVDLEGEGEVVRDAARRMLPKP